MPAGVSWTLSPEDARKRPPSAPDAPTPLKESATFPERRCRLAEVGAPPPLVGSSHPRPPHRESLRSLRFWLVQDEPSANPFTGTKRSDTWHDPNRGWDRPRLTDKNAPRTAQSQMKPCRTSSCFTPSSLAAEVQLSPGRAPPSQRMGEGTGRAQNHVPVTTTRQLHLPRGSRLQ